MGISLLKSEGFGKMKCDFYKNSNNEIFMTRKQIGEALEYLEPQKAIDKLHELYQDRLDKFSVTVTLGGTDGKKYETLLYSTKGIYEICRWSRQPKADDFMDWVWDVIEGTRKILSQKQTEEWKETRQSGKLFQKDLNDTIKTFADYAKAQGSQRPEMYYLHFAKLCNSVVGIQTGKRELAEAKQLATQIFIIDVIKNILDEEMKAGVFYKDIFKACKDRIQKLLSIGGSHGDKNSKG